MPYHLIATLSGGRRKSLHNRSEQQVLTAVVQFESTGTISANWGAKTHAYQVLELRIYQTSDRWRRPTDGPLESFLGKKKRNLYPKFQTNARVALGRKTHRIFVIMPIQGEKYGSQDEQRIYKEFDQRFEAIEAVVAPLDCVAIRIDKEHPIEDLVNRIKEEIRRATFIIADLTDERPSCYFEAGFAESIPKPVIYVASKESVVNPKTPTRIHFDVHMNVNFFTNHGELAEKLTAAIDKNKGRLFPKAAELPIEAA